MKRIISLIMLTLVFLCAFSVGASAESLEEELVSDFFDYCGGNNINENGNFDYKVYILEHKEKDNMIFFSGKVNWISPSDVEISERFGEWYLYCPVCYYPSEYGIYVKIDDNIYTLTSAWENRLINDLSCIEEFSKLSKVYCVGDTDLDKEISILDATLIQLNIAELVEFEFIQNEIGDVDNDGEISVLDSTGIQLKLAKF